MFSRANIAPLVAYLATEKCPHTGQVFAVAGRLDPAAAGAGRSANHRVDDPGRSTTWTAAWPSGSDAMIEWSETDVLIRDSVRSS